MISSRWPRPMGTIESIDFRPVCTGCDTDWRAITPGATFSITSVIFALIGPLPSIGWPSALTTRPISSGPTGTSRMRPVHLTVSPSEMCSYSPRITEPTESRSRFSARPKDGWPSLPAGNSSISPAITSDRPWMRTMPSVTETTVPWLRMSVDGCRPSMRLLISSEISAGFSCMTSLLGAPPSGGQSDLHLLQAGLHRGVEHLVADHDANATDQFGIDLDRRVELAAEALLQRRHHLGQLRGVDREGAVHLGIRHARLRVDQRVVLRGNLGQRREAAVVDDRVQQVLRGGRQRRLHDIGDHGVDLVARHLGVVGELAQLLVLRDVGERRDFGGQVTTRGLEQGLGVGAGDGCKFGHGDQSSVRRRPSRSACAAAFTSLRRIASAPRTASAATSSRSASRALTISCVASAFAAATILAASSLARALASSISDCARRSASARRLATSSRAADSCDSTRWFAAARSAFAFSAADRPAALFLERP